MGPREKASSGKLLLIYPSISRPQENRIFRGLTSKAFGPDVSGEQDPWPLGGLGLPTPALLSQRQPTQYRTMRSASSDYAMPASGKKNG